MVDVSYKVPPETHSELELKWREIIWGKEPQEAMTGEQEYKTMKRKKPK